MLCSQIINTANNTETRRIHTDSCKMYTIVIGGNALFRERGKLEVGKGTLTIYNLTHKDEHGNICMYKEKLQDPLTLLTEYQLHVNGKPSLSLH